MDDEIEVEFAMLRRADGTPVPRTAARRQLEKLKQAVALAGGRAPRDRDGRPMVWNEARGWHPRSGADGRNRRLTLEELSQRQKEVELDIYFERLTARMNGRTRS